MTLTLAQQIASTLRQAIRRGTYVCGDRLVELTLAQEFSVSQNTIRDALHILEKEAWAVKIPRKGVYIPKFTLDEVEEIFALWEALENLALHWSITRSTSTDFKQLHNMLIEAEKKVDQSEWFHASEALRNFHSAIANYAKAPRILRILSRLHSQIMLLENYRFQSLPLSLEEWDTRIDNYFELLHEINHPENQRIMHYHKKAIAYETTLIMPFLD